MADGIKTCAKEAARIFFLTRTCIVKDDVTQTQRCALFCIRASIDKNRSEIGYLKDFRIIDSSIVGACASLLQK